MCKPFLVFSLSLGQAEQHLNTFSYAVSPRPNVENRWKMTEFDTEKLILVEGLIFLTIMISHNVDPITHQVNAM